MAAGSRSIHDLMAIMEQSALCFRQVMGQASQRPAPPPTVTGLHVHDSQASLRAQQAGEKLASLHALALACKRNQTPGFLACSCSCLQTQSKARLPCMPFALLAHSLELVATLLACCVFAILPTKAADMLSSSAYAVFPLHSAARS